MRGSERVHHEARGVRGHAAVPGLAVVQALRERVDAAELQPLARTPVSRRSAGRCRMLAPFDHHVVVLPTFGFASGEPGA